MSIQPIPLLASHPRYVEAAAKLESATAAKAAAHEKLEDMQRKKEANFGPHYIDHRLNDAQQAANGASVCAAAEKAKLDRVVSELAAEAWAKAGPACCEAAKELASRAGVSRLRVEEIRAILQRFQDAGYPQRATVRGCVNSISRALDALDQTVGQLNDALGSAG
jgi:hypothetical protein